VTLIAAGRTLTLTLPPLTIRDLGVAEGGITADQVASRVLKQLLAQMAAAAVEVLREVGAGALEGGKEGAGSVINRLIGR
jgi:hypothetical protein